ncbi:restriction endonuclease subunit S [Brevundimonas naejangsanensis]|uniref:restriction endonuclease subunit S n=1 Tax=Brevundimonas naejangsanensis TaxID=588932 RepID=UPI00106A9500|nr:restriction endonuclease subunit S [Brevundimonas naejangsanensis]QBQ49513.1 restriction endonuclease subunit S [Brevundimonas naejangsanensis]
MSGNLPEGWALATLGEVVRLEYGRALSASARDPGNIPVYGSNGVCGEHSAPLVPERGIVVGRKGTAGSVTVTTGPFWPIDTTYYVVPRLDVDFDWLAATLEHARLHELNESTGVPGLNRDKAYLQSILLPPLDEQRRIAEVLRSVDEAIGMTEQALGQSRVLKAGLLRELFTKGVGHSDFKETRLGLLPSKWDVRPLGSCFENLDSQRRPVKKEERAQMRGAIPYYGASGIIDWVSDHLFDEPLLLLAEDGANLISKSTPIAFISTGKSWVNNHAHVYRPTTALDIALAEEWLSFTDISPFITGSAQPKLNKDRADAILMPIPPVEEQARMKEIFRAVNQTIAEESSKLRVLRDVKLNLANDLLSGRVRVPA